MCRLLEGSETTKEGHAPWMTMERNIEVKKGLVSLRMTVEHLVEHLEETDLDKDVLQEIRWHMDDMDTQLHTLHNQVEKATSRWSRHHHDLVTTNEGDTLPMQLVVPVTMDCFVDGFLIGITSSISFSAGIILALANCLEMGFLGMAYSARLVKCTGSSYFVRTIALYGPPLLMWASACVGAALGDATKALSAVFIGMVAFGSVSLLFLVCNELLIEAREAQGDDERWWISAMVFLGIYIVLMANHIIS